MGLLIKTSDWVATYGIIVSAIEQAINYETENLTLAKKSYSPSQTLINMHEERIKKLNEVREIIVSTSQPVSNETPFSLTDDK